MKMPRSIRGRPAAIVTLALVLSMCVQPARAAGGDDTDEGWKKVLSFARCALNVFRAMTPTDWMVATLDCGRLMMEEPTYPGGGQP